MKLTAKKYDKLIIINVDEFEHLLNCLDNQKFIPSPTYQSVFERQDIQQPIDDFNLQCRDLLNGKDSVAP